MHTEYFKYLLTVADCHSIRRAAELLHMKQQNLSTIIKNMEQHYSIIIFERSYKGVTLTADGKFFLNEVRALLGTLNRMESLYLYPSKRCYNGLVDGINIYCTSLISSHSLVSVLEQFREYFPYVHVNLLIRSREDILKMQPNEPKSLSLVFASVNSGNTGNPFLDLAENVIVEPYARTAVFAATAKNNASAQALNTISVHELLKKKLIVLSQDQKEDTFAYELLDPYGTPDIQYVVNNPTIFIDLLQRNDLWSICIADRVPQDTLRLIPFAEDFQLQAYLLYHEEAKDNFALMSLLKLFSTTLLSATELLLI